MSSKEERRRGVELEKGYVGEAALYHVDETLNSTIAVGAWTRYLGADIVPHRNYPTSAQDER